jgi:oligopeptide/dipeptide ABC transporter ATP-binding protein
VTDLLFVANLSKRFAVRRNLLDALRGRGARALHAVDDVTLSVARGETLGIVGESGCGKSTLARCLVRLYEPDEGTIRFDGKDVLELRGTARRAYNRQVQMVFQDPFGSLNPRMTVGACLAEALAVHDIVPKAAIARRVEELLDLVHLPADAAARRPHEFSGGQRQRIGIARALAVEPSLIIADEPVSALDVSVQAQIVNLLLELQRRLGLTLVFITHDLRLVRHLTHRVAVMYLGRIVEIGPTEQLFAAPRHPYTRALLEAAPRLVPGRPSRVDAARGELPSPLAPPSGCAFHPRCRLAEPRCSVERPALAPRGGDWPMACLLED